MTNLPDEKAAPLPDSAGQCCPGDTCSTPSGEKVSTERGDHISREHHQVGRDWWTEGEVKPVEWKEHSSLRRSQQRQASEDVRIPKRQVAGADQTRGGNAHWNIENHAVIWGDNQTPARCREEIEEREQRDDYRGRTTRRYFRMKTEWKTH